MELDLKAVSALAMEHAGASISTMAVTIGIGLLITVAVIVGYGRFGVFRRPGYAGWHVVSKCWIAFLLIAGIVVSVKAGMVRAAHHALRQVAQPTVEAIYDGTVGDALDSEANKRAFLLSLQTGGKSAQDLGKALSHALKERLDAVPDSARSLSGKAAALLAGAVIDHYQDDLTAAVLYGIYAKTGGYLELHHTGEPMDYATFKEGVDHLLNIDVGTMRNGVKENLSAFANELLERNYRHFLTGVWVLALVLAAIPLLDLLAYTLVGRQRGAEVQPPDQPLGP